MSKRIFAEFDGEKREIALVEDGKLLWYAADSGGAVQAEQIYLGRVDRIMKGMEAAFVLLSKSVSGFLPFSECIETPVSGKRVLVQVKKPPIGEKKCYLTQNISLAGRCAVLTPCAEKCAVSHKITDEDERKHLYQMAMQCKSPKMGLVLRTESVGVTEAELRQEVSALMDKWQNVLALSAKGEMGLIQEREDALNCLLRDEHGQIEEIITNRPEALPAVQLPVRFSENVFALENVRNKLRKGWQRKVWLDCGGFLVIDRTEALTVIDVNSGKYAGEKKGAESTFLKLNLEAAEEIARLMRLRNMGGIIMVDFVDMAAEEGREAVTEALKTALLRDPVKCVIHGFTTLGLVELTRKKTEASLSPVPLCPRCGGTGLMEEEPHAE